MHLSDLINESCIIFTYKMQKAYDHCLVDKANPIIISYMEHQGMCMQSAIVFRGPLTHKMENFDGAPGLIP